MKIYKPFLVFAIAVISFGCKSSIDGTAQAEEVCACRMKTKGMQIGDPVRRKIWSECSVIQGNNWSKLKGDKVAETAYNKKLNECLQEVLYGK